MESIRWTSDETQHLRRGMRDLIALSTLPALWTAADRLGIAESLAEALQRMLSADFIYLRLRGPSGDPPVEAARTPQMTGPPIKPPVLREALEPWLNLQGAATTENIPNPIGNGIVRLVALPIGHEQDCGWLAAGSDRPDFPTETERLLLGVGVNQALIVLQRKEAETQLHRNEQELADFFENAVMGLHWVGPDGTILRANRTELDLLGYTREEYIGHPIAEFHADQSVIQDIMRRLRMGEALHDYEARMRCKDGSIKYVLINSNGLWENGRFVHSRCFTRDITARKRAEMLLEAVLSSINDHVVCYDRQWRYTYVNDKAAEVLGKRKEKLLGRSIWEIFPDAVGNQYYREVHQALAEQKIIRSEHHYAPFDTWFENHIYPSSDGVTVFSADVTWRKKAEEHLRQSEARYRALVEAGSQIVWSWKPETGEGDYEAVQRWWEELTGQPPSAQGGTGWLEMLHPGDRDRVSAAWNLAMTTATKFEAEYRLQTRAGTVRHLLSRTVPVRDASGGVWEWVGMMIDITEQKRQEEALKEADRRKDEFLAMLAHELRNPLAPIRNGLELIHLAGGDQTTLEEARAMMERQVGQLVRLTDDLLDVARITRGKIELRKERVLLMAVVNSAVEASRPLIKKQGHELTVTLPPEPVVLEADPTRLAQTMSNLLNNAAKYTDPGGHIWLTVQMEKEDVLIHVKDTGIGIPSEMLSRIFEMFTQVDQSLERTHGGLGIGLTLAKRLVEMHGGRIEARSAGFGRGSEFIVRLPISVPPAKEKEPSRRDVTKRLSQTGRRILVVDDHEDSAKIMAIMLKKMGNEPRTAFNGAEAIEVAEVFRPDLIFLDIGMPKLNGYDAARRIREQPWGRDILLVALTGWGQEEDKRRSREAGFNFHLIKPIEPGALKKLLADLDTAQHPPPNDSIPF
jgi:PAS domain S-box-containing protein